MALFSMNDAEKYGNTTSGSFFQLKNDKDVARVRFLYNSVDDCKGCSVHVVKIDGRDRNVNCLRTYDEPIDKCPLCKAGNKIKPRLFVRLYNEDTKEFQIWERGKNFYSDLAGLSNRYKPLYNEVCDIERHGKVGDIHTTYSIWPTENSEIDIDEYLDKCPNPIGMCVLEKTAEEMEDYIATGNFSSADSLSVARRRETQDTNASVGSDEGQVRRRRTF